MNSLITPLHEHRVLSVTAHPDDLEMHHVGILDAAQTGHAYIASDGEASTVDHTRSSLCRPCPH